MDQFKTPILIIIFNRPEVTRRTFEVLKKIKPEKLFIVADGPRKGNLDDPIKCQKTREVFNEINWPCQIYKKFSDINLGCDINVYTGIDWFFSKVEEGIILEDDCLVDLSFFNFSQEMLDRYRDNERIMHISGDNFQFGIKRGSASYYFSRYAHCWGWATWKRAWDKFDWNMKSYPRFYKENKLNNIFLDSKQKKYWSKFFKLAYQKVNNVWDGKWVYAVISNNGLCIVPNVNLVSNIGFGSDATHTVKKGILTEVRSESLENIVHPDKIEVNREADDLSFRNYFFTPLHERVLNKLFSFFKK